MKNGDASIVEGDELPKGWATARVEQVIEDFQPGFASGEKNVEGGVAHLRMNNIGLDGELVLDLLRTVPEKLAKSRHDLCRGDVLVCTTNSGKLVGKCAFFDLPGRYVFSNHLTRLRPNDALVDGRFLRWSLWLQWRSGAFDDQCKHWVNQSTLPKDALLESEMPLPPLPEQRRIMAKLEMLLGKVDASQRRLAKIPRLLKRFRQSVLAAACSGRLTADWRRQNPTVETGDVLLGRIREKRLALAQTKKEKAQIEEVFDEANLRIDEGDRNEIPDTWIHCRVGAVGTVCNGSTPSRTRPEFWGGEIPWVSSGQVRNNVIAETRERITKAGYESSSVRLLPPGTVLLAMIGEGKTRGQTAILNIEATINQNIAAVVLEHGLVSSEFLWRWFQLQYEATRERGSGSGPQALNCQRVREIPFVLPPLTEQQEIVRRVEQFFTFADQLEARFAKAQVHVDKLTQSLLAKAFRGELVPQDPNDEPASALLERIGRCAAGKR
jgi:type I restriction enzyme S subunit